MTDRTARSVLATWVRHVHRVDRATVAAARQNELLSATALVDEIAVRTATVRKDKKLHAMALALREALADMTEAPAAPEEVAAVTLGAATEPRLTLSGGRLVAHFVFPCGCCLTVDVLSGERTHLGLHCAGHLAAFVAVG